MRELGIEFISVFGLPPVDFVHTAADTSPSRRLPADQLRESLGYLVFSLKDDAWLGANVSDLALCLNSSVVG